MGRRRRMLLNGNRRRMLLSRNRRRMLLSGNKRRMLLSDPEISNFFICITSVRISGFLVRA